MFEGNDVQNAFAFLSSRLKSTTVQKVQVCFREEAAPRQPNRIENGQLQKRIQGVQIFLPCTFENNRLIFENGPPISKMTGEVSNRSFNFDNVPEIFKIFLGNHDMQQAFNMRSYESDFNDVEDEDVYNLLLSRDRPDLEEAKQKPPKLTEIILSQFSMTHGP